MKPDISHTVVEAQNKQILNHDKGRTKLRHFVVDDLVRVRNYRGGKIKWLLGIVTKVCGPRSYLVRVGERVRFVHIDQMLHTGEIFDSENTSRT